MKIQSLKCPNSIQKCLKLYVISLLSIQINVGEFFPEEVPIQFQ